VSSSDSDRRAVVVAAGDGKAMIAGGSGTIFKLDAGDTGGGVSVVEHPIDPGVLVPPHVHSREDQISHVVEGEVEMLVGDDVLHCAAGAWVFKPRGLRHTFWNAGERPARLAEISSPGGVERYMEELFGMLAAGPPDPGQLQRLAAEYGITLLPSLAQQLAAERGLRIMGR
jgi:quercetin dioxygenase-like cupin family protein